MYYTLCHDRRKHLKNFIHFPEVPVAAHVPPPAAIHVVQEHSLGF